jgi:hypothetical protein
MESKGLIARIDQLLKRQPLPSDAELEKILKILQEARGSRPSTAASDASSSRPATATSALTNSGAFLSTASSSKVNTPANDTGGLSLVLGESEDPIRLAYLERHEKRHAEGIRKPVDVRERKTRQYQDLLAGRGGKYTHVDYVPNGATQIGGITSQTPSMTADFTNPKMLSQVKGRLAAGQQTHFDNRFNFRF